MTCPLRLRGLGLTNPKVADRHPPGLAWSSQAAAILAVACVLSWRRSVGGEEMQGSMGEGPHRFQPFVEGILREVTPRIISKEPSKVGEQGHSRW